MTLIQTIELEGDDFMEVELIAFPEFIDPSYSDEFGLVKLDDYAHLEEMPTWDKNKFTEKENESIARYLLNNYNKIEDKFLRLLEQETIPDNY